jgi:single-strand DNA-binding protein
MYLNKVFLYGNLTRDPEIRALPSGSQVASFAIATNRVYKDAQGAKQEAVEYHNIVVFGRQAEIIGQYMKKGRPIFVEGRVQTRSYEKDGVKHYRTEIVSERFQFGPSGGGAGGSGGSMGGSSRDGVDTMPKEDTIEYPSEEINPEDIPF